MIRHIVLMQWSEPLDDDKVQIINDGLGILFDEMPGVRGFSVGPDLSIFKGNADYAIVVDFSTEKDFKNYVFHPDHLKFMKEVTNPLLASFQSLQFQVA